MCECCWLLGVVVVVDDVNVDGVVVCGVEIVVCCCCWV